MPVKLFETHAEALRYEEKIQRQLSVVQNPLYVNMAFANRGFHGSGGHVEESKEKIRRQKIGKSWGSHAPEAKLKISRALLGKEKSISHRAAMSRSATGKKQERDVIEKRAEKLRGRPLSQAARTSISKALKNPGNERRAKLSQAQRKRHIDTVVRVKDPHGTVHVINSLQDFCELHGLYHTSMLRTLRSGRPLQSGSNKGWQLLSIDKNGSFKTN